MFRCTVQHVPCIAYLAEVGTTVGLGDVAADQGSALAARLLLPAVSGQGSNKGVVAGVAELLQLLLLLVPYIAVQLRDRCAAQLRASCQPQKQQGGAAAGVCACPKSEKLQIGSQGSSNAMTLMTPVTAKMQLTLTHQRASQRLKGCLQVRVLHM